MNEKEKTERDIAVKLLTKLAESCFESDENDCTSWHDVGEWLREEVENLKKEIEEK